tara:strand:+ start:247 stop:549 length:303 start_codon:yes stop_codon:yes gene_type:complete
MHFELGKVIHDYLHNIANTFKDCIEVRGKGLMWGIELEPDIATRVFEDLKNRNFLVGLGGSRKNVLRVLPPMCLTKTDLKKLYSALYATMEKHSVKYSLV